MVCSTFRQWNNVIFCGCNVLVAQIADTLCHYGLIDPIPISPTMRFTVLPSVHHSKSYLLALGAPPPSRICPLGFHGKEHTTIQARSTSHIGNRCCSGVDRVAALGTAYTPRAPSAANATVTHDPGNKPSAAATASALANATRNLLYRLMFMLDPE